MQIILPAQGPAFRRASAYRGQPVKGNLIAAAMIAVALCGCATGYQSANNPLVKAGILVSGGYWEEPGPGRLIKVGYFANGLTRPRDVGNYLLYRCAEVAQREGATHFVLYNTLPDAISDVRSSERTVNANFGKPSTFAYILPAAENEPSALSAADLIARLGPLVKPAKEKAS